MRFLTNEESLEWCKGYGYEVADGAPMLSYELRIRYPKSAPQLLAMAGVIEDILQYYSTCLVWVTQSGIWRSSENLHLYHVWRKSHGDSRFLFEAPGHWFLDYERTDLITLLHMALLFGWDAHVVPSPNGAAAFLSHDEVCDFAFSHEASIPAVMERFAKMGLHAKRLG